MNEQRIIRWRSQITVYNVKKEMGWIVVSQKERIKDCPKGLLSDDPMFDDFGIWLAYQHGDIDENGNRTYIHEKRPDDEAPKKDWAKDWAARKKDWARAKKSYKYDTTRYGSKNPECRMNTRIFIENDRKL